MKALRGVLLMVLVATVGPLPLAPAPASAALTHAPVEKILSTPNCGGTDIAVDESAGLIYAVCTGFMGVGNSLSIARFDLNGNPVSFTASGSYLSGNLIIEDPSNAANGELGGNALFIAVDNSPANNGDLFVGSDPPSGGGGSGNIDVFDRTGKWLTAIPIKSAPGGAGNPNGVDVGADGSIYVNSEQGFGYSHVSKFTPAFREVQRMLLPDGAGHVRVDSTGAIWVNSGSGGIAEPTKYEADQFDGHLNTDLFSIQGLGLTYAPPSPFAANPLLSGGFTSFDVDPTNDDLYVDSEGKIAPYSPGDAAEPAHKDGPEFGNGVIAEGGNAGIAVTADGHVYASAAGEGVAVFPPGAIVPDIATPAPRLDEIGHTSTTITAELERAGGPAIDSCQIKYGTDKTYSGPGSGTAPCSPDPSGSSFTDPSTQIEATLSGLATGTTYHYQVEAGNANGANFGGDRTVTPAAVLSLRTLAAAEVDLHDATLKGSFDPDNLNTTYHFEYGLDAGYGQVTPDVPLPASTGVHTVGAAIGSLPTGSVFHYRIVAENSLGITRGQDVTFRSASAPLVSGVRSTDVTDSSAVLHARIDPVGFETSYRFEYGTSAALGTSVPIPDADLGAGNAPVDVEQPISGLASGVTYHFRVVATNKWGSTASEDTTFGFLPPGCPNAHVRQQTRTNYLPDCRAYELVSPGDAGAALLFPSEEFARFHETFDGFPIDWQVNRGLATSPARFAFFAGGGTIPGLDAPNGAFDLYTATRTDSGWVTALPGLSGHQTILGAEKECSDDLSVCIDHKGAEPLSNCCDERAPYLFAADGKALGQLPSNVNAISGGNHLSGDQRLSGDGKHLVFSSNGIRFTPDGIKQAPGSAYDDDIGAKTVTVVSKLANGSAIPEELNPVNNAAEYLKFPAVSTDGSHILMQLGSQDSLTSSIDRVHLYMRVDGSTTYDVTRGAGATFVGMTADGSEVYFLTDKHLDPGDTDNGADLYRWSENGDTITWVSHGNDQGNSDACSAAYVPRCDVTALSTELAHPFGIVSASGIDDLLARNSGDVYFYSPEAARSG